MNKEICWNITARCNQGCKYCHRFLGIKELTFEENNEVLGNLIKQGVSEITWTGGEALIVDEIEQLLKTSYENGIKNKLITNGMALTNERIDEILPYLDSLTLSLDSIDSITNENLGRGINHYNNINRILEYIKLKKYEAKIRINTVMTKINMDSMKELSDYLNQFKIYSWRIFKFMPLRETSIKNRNLFEITNNEYENELNRIKNNSPIGLIESRVSDDMENKYILILADGSIVVTRNGEDVIIGNALTTSLTGDSLHKSLSFKKNLINGGVVA